jgi:P27 family predicted phage terminase small subunit
MAGRKPKPTQLHVLDGTLRPDRRHGQNEPTAERGDCSPPDHLSDEVRVVWERLSPEMIQKELLAPRYMETFEAFCIAVVNMRRAALLIDKMGPVIRNEKGQPKTNPASWEFARYTRIMQSLGGDLGLTPVGTAVIGRGVNASLEYRDRDRRNPSAARLLS